MTADRPSFRSERKSSSGAGLAVLALVALVVGVAATRPLWTPGVPDGVAIEVRGEVDRPGLHLVDPPTVRAAVEAAGGDGERFPETPLREGDRVVVEGEQARVLPPSDPLLVGLPIDLRTCDAAALAAVPGLRRSTAEVIVQWRDAHGPFRGPDDLEQVPGVGPGTVELLAPFVTYGTEP